MIKNKNIVFLGPPGVGKGTIALHLKENYDLVHISTGEIFRQEIAKQTLLGQQVESIMAKGDYVPDEITNQIVKNILFKKEIKEKGFILDGYPRTENQAQFLDNINIKIDYVFYLFATDEIINKRLLNRRRDDDNIQTIKNRIEVYKKQTQPLIEYYKKQNKLFQVDVSGSLSQNIENLLEVVKSEFNKN